MKNNKSLGKVWENVSKDHRHLPRNNAVIKNENYLHDSLIKSNYEKSFFKTILDWGPGGGWLSKSFDPEKVYFFDIVPGFQDEIKKNFNNEKLNFYLLENEKFPDLNDQFDLAILYSVLYHMPSIDYVINVIKYITSLEPNTIAIRNIFTDKESWDRSIESYDSKNYIRGNVFNKSDFLNIFKKSGYSIKYEHVDKNLWETSSHEIDKLKKTYSCIIVLSKN